MTKGQQIHEHIFEQQKKKIYDELNSKMLQKKANQDNYNYGYIYNKTHYVTL